MKKLLIAILALLGLMPCAQGQEGLFALSGTVSENGEPGALIRVSLQAEGKKVKSTRTDFGGSYRIDSLAAGEYKLEVWQFDYFTYDTLIQLASNLQLDTIFMTLRWGELSEKLWPALDRQDSLHPATDFYRRTYIDFRRAIDSLAPAPTLENPYSTDCIGRITDAMALIEALPGIRMERGWVLDIDDEGYGIGGAMFLYTRRRKAARGYDWKKKPERLQHIMADFTPQGLWSAYLLYESFKFIPKDGIGYYGRCDEVFSTDELKPFFRGRLATKNAMTRDSLMAVPPLCHHIEIADDRHAVITAYYWNDWKGLTETHTYVERTPKGLKFHPVTEEGRTQSWQRVLAPYHCGMHIE